MATVKMTALGGLRTKSVHVKSGTEFISDAPVDNRGKGEYFSPTDILSASLAACMITIMDIAGQEHGFSVEGAEVDITKIMSDKPRRIAEIIVEINFPANNYSDKAKKIIEYATKNCPVSLSLHPDVKQTIILNYK